MPSLSLTLTDFALTHLRHQANQGFGFVDVQLIYNENPAVRICGNRLGIWVAKSSSVRVGPSDEVMTRPVATSKLAMSDRVP